MWHSQHKVAVESSTLLWMCWRSAGELSMAGQSTMLSLSDRNRQKRQNRFATLNSQFTKCDRQNIFYTFRCVPMAILGDTTLTKFKYYITHPSFNIWLSPYYIGHIPYSFRADRFWFRSWKVLEVSISVHPNGLPTGGSVLVYLIMFLMDHKRLMFWCSVRIK